MNRLQLIRTAFLVVVGAIVFWVIYTILKRPEPGPAADDDYASTAPHG